jgi:TonB family protein
MIRGFARGFLVMALGVSVLSQEGFTPARFRAGAPPMLPALAVGGGEVFAELQVNRDGRVTGVTPLRTTAPFDELVLSSVRSWLFYPAEDDLASVTGTPGVTRARTAVASHVLVAALFRPPVLLGPTLGEPPSSAGRASGDIPYPLQTTMPGYPPTARDRGVVMLEAIVDRTGLVTDVKVIESAPPFDEPAMDAARQWVFRPANIRGLPASSSAYLIFGFQAPVTGPPPTRAPGGQN